jgi:hypothetical protein
MIAADLKVSGMFSVIESEDGKFLVRDPYGKIECSRNDRDTAQRIVSAANAAMASWNAGDRLSHGGDI